MHNIGLEVYVYKIFLEIFKLKHGRVFDNRWRQVYKLHILLAILAIKRKQFCLKTSITRKRFKCLVGWLVVWPKKINNKFGLSLCLSILAMQLNLNLNVCNLKFFFFFFLVAFDRICLAKEFNKSLHKLLAI